MSANDSHHYRVEHRTTYRYSEPAMLSHQQLHLKPRQLVHQKSRTHEIHITPVPNIRRENIDAFGNPVTEFTIEAPHRALEVVAQTSIDAIPRVVPDPEKTPSWETARDALQYRPQWHPEPIILEAMQFLFESRYARVKRNLRAYTADCFHESRPILAAAVGLMAKIHNDFEFDTGATTVTTPVIKFFEQRRGVCQDFAHLMISCLRSIGLAARYVSGYLLTHPAPGKPWRPGADASHAWVSLFVPDNDWIDLDPTNNLIPSVEHITLGWGRDFADVSPLRGVINGGGVQTLDVRVTVEPANPA